IYTSRDSGASWSLIAAPAERWVATACAGDGNSLVAVGREIYDGPSPSVAITVQFPIQQPPQPPPMSHWLSIHSLSASANVSWLVPSTRSILQENLDMTSTNWTDVLIDPALNFNKLALRSEPLAIVGQPFLSVKAAIVERTHHEHRQTLCKDCLF